MFSRSSIRRGLATTALIAIVVVVIVIIAAGSYIAISMSSKSTAVSTVTATSVVTSVATGSGSLTTVTATQTASASSTSSPSSSLVKGTVLFGLSSTVTFEYLPYQIAMQGGFWAQQGLNVTEVVSSSGSNNVKAMLADQVDIISTSPLQDFTLDPSIYNFQAVAIQLSQADMVIIVGNHSSYTSPSQLAGATIGITSVGSETDAMVHLLADYYNLTVGTAKGDIHEVALGGSLSAQEAAVFTNQTQAFVWTYDQGVELQSTGDGKILTYMSSIIPSYPSVIIAASNAEIRNHPQLVQEFLQGYFNAIAYARSNLTYTDQVAAQYLGLSMSVAAQIVNQSYFGTNGFSTNGAFTTAAVTGLNLTRNVVLQLGFATSAIPLSSFYTTQFVPVTTSSNPAPSAPTLSVSAAGQALTASSYYAVDQSYVLARDLKLAVG